VVAVAAVAFTAPAAASEQGVVRGRVVTALDGTPIAGASVVADGVPAVTGDDGGFVLFDVAPGPVELLAEADGYLPAVVAIAAAERTDARIALATDGGAEVIEVRGTAPEQAASTTYALDRDQVRTLPGGGNDALRAVQSLPGVARVPWGLGGLYLRGTNLADSNVFVDGVEVPLAFHFGGLTSFYPTGLLERVEVTPGGTDARYGRGIGGVVEIESRAGRRDRVRFGSELGLLDVSAYGEGPTPAGGSIALGVRRSHVDLLLAALGVRFEPRYYDAQLRWDQPLAGGVLTTLAFASHDRVTSDDDLDVKQSFVRAALRYQRRVGATTYTVMPWSGASAAAARTESDGDGATLSLAGDIARWPYGIRAEAIRDGGWGHAAVGLDVAGARVDRPVSSGLLDDATTRETTTYTNVGVWTEARWRIADGKLTIKPGVRSDYLALRGRWFASPRLGVAHELTPWLTVREFLGLDHQPPGPTDAFLPDDDDRARGEKAKRRPPIVRGIQASIGASAQLPRSIRVSVTGYHVARRPLTRRIPFDPAQPRGITAPTVAWVIFDNLVGEDLVGVDRRRGRSWGVELTAERTTEALRLWLAYTLSRSERVSETLDRIGWRPYDLDQTHNLNLVASWRRGPWQLGGRLRAASGLPYTPAVIDADNGGTTRRHSLPNSARLPAFVSVDVHAERSWPRRWGTVTLYADVQNLTNATNPEAVEGPDSDPHYVRGLPILPMVGVSFSATSVR